MSAPEMEGPGTNPEPAAEDIPEQAPEDPPAEPTPQETEPLPPQPPVVPLNDVPSPQPPVVHLREVPLPRPPVVHMRNVEPPQPPAVHLRNVGPPRPPVVHMRNFPTMFGDIREHHVTFCIDTSGSMYRFIDAVKEHLIEAITSLAYRDADNTFNVVEFSTGVMQWSDKMVRCTPETVAVAVQWIKDLQPKTGTNTMDALVSAFQDEGCSAVYLVTDGIPDQEATEVLDRAIYAAGNRPVHCFYVQDGKTDEQATTLLQDLAMESYGSFHVITIAQHGVVERITPVYRAECAAEQVVRTNTGGIVTANDKLTSMTTTLNHIPSVLEHPIIVPSLAAPLPYPHYPYFMYPYPQRHYYEHCVPVESWSRYRPARSWIKGAKECVMDGIDFVPGPGAMLIGTTVFGRRQDDGLFYVGKVKSELRNQKFLVEFGPCKHGKWKDTVYQETFVYDIISYDDGMRHAIVTHDKVLAPWEPEGERYGPGVVIEGQERRTAGGGGPDVPLIVAFHNGKTASVPANVAVWIPSALHERAEFEIKLPRKVRREFSQQSYYPEENLPGYPTSDTGAIPREYDVVHSRWVNPPEHLYMSAAYPCYYPRSPAYYYPDPPSYPRAPSAVRGEDVDALIPGTELTKSALNEKVMSQLMQHKMVLEDRRVRCDQETARLLSRRSREETKSILKQNRHDKSVSFGKGDESDLEGEFDAGDLEVRDSGRGSSEALSSDEYFSDSELRQSRQSRISGYESEGDLHYCTKGRRSRSRSAGRCRSRSRSHSKSRERPPWRYWNTDSAPEMLEPMHYGPYRVGPYEESVTPVPIELREQRMGPYGVEWNAALGGYVDSLAKYRGEGSVKESMGYYPHPPQAKPDKQGPGVDISLSVGGNLSEAERAKLSRREFRRARAIGREEDWQKRLVNEDKMTMVMRDQHRERIMDQIGRERSRQQEQIDRVAAQREAKKQINEQLRGRIEENVERERARSESRLEAARANRARRDDIAVQRRKEVEDKMARSQEAKKYNNEKRWHAHCARMAESDTNQAAMGASRQTAHANRQQRFRMRENVNQQRNQLKSQLNASGLYSQVFP